MASESKFYPYARIVTGVAIAAVLLILISNLQGFFVRPEDDPEWTPPPGSEQVVQEAGQKQQAAKGPGAELYARHCATCHQPNGKGLPKVYPPLAGSELLQGDPVHPIAIVLYGFRGKIQRNGQEYDGVMTPFGNQLSDEEIAQILTYVRNSWGNSADSVTPEMVAQVREMTKGRTQPMTEEDLMKLEPVSQ